MEDGLSLRYDAHDMMRWGVMWFDMIGYEATWPDLS